MRKIAVIIYGPPGSGKGTQANLIADKLGLIHFDTGKFMEAVVHSRVRQKEKIIQRERKLFDAGKLMTPSFVFKEVARTVKKIAKAGWGIIFSGSPRTEYEAKGLLPILEKLYGRRNIFLFVLKIPAKDSISRNGSRVICKVCGAPLLTKYYPSKNYKYCPICGGPFYKRILDKPQTIKIRLQEYAKRTKPVFEILKKRGYRLIEIDGRPAPYKIFQKIISRIGH
jgi:adenylate kinase